MDDIHERLAGCLLQNSADIKKYFYHILQAPAVKIFDYILFVFYFAIPMPLVHR